LFFSCLPKVEKKTYLLFGTSADTDPIYPGTDPSDSMSKYPLVIKHTLKIHQTVLVGGFTHLEKYESQWDGLSHVYYGK